MANVISQTLHKSQILSSDCPEGTEKYCLCLDKRGNGVVSESWNLYKDKEWLCVPIQ